jgi:hypothetical protein
VALFLSNDWSASAKPTFADVGREIGVRRQQSFAGGDQRSVLGRRGMAASERRDLPLPA